MRPVLVLRPEPGASATGRRAGAMGLPAIVAPLFTVVPCAWRPADPAGFDALLLTSANAVRHAGAALELYAGLPAWTVGAATAQAARAAGVRVVRSGGEDAASLMDEMAAARIRRVLHLAGREHRAGEPPSLTVTRCIVYQSDAVPALPPAAASALDRGCVVLLHSARAGATMDGLTRELPRVRSSIVAMSDRAGHAAGGGWREVRTAAQPTDHAMLAVAAELCKEAA